MLDPKKRETRDASANMSQIVDLLHQGEFSKANTLLNSFKGDLSAILEKGWSDVKEDLRNPGKSLKSR
jgi:hypothetical protein